jgi:1-acyl-sn-glycerol-3-phosphate acyltransferase
VTRALRAVRSAGAFVLLLIVFGIGGGLYQRLVLWPATRLWPSGRERLMWRFMIVMAGWVLAILRLGGASFSRSGKVPARSGPRLVLMNHQSLLDIPTIFLVCAPELPPIVTRARYGRRVPLVSLMLRILEYPLVDPEREPRTAIATLRRAAEASAQGLLIFPEGHRSRDGSIGPFETAGLRVVLGQRRMPVYLIVTDGFWVSRRLSDLVFRVHEIRGRTEVVGPFEPPARSQELPRFVEELRERMIAQLEAMRRQPGVAGVAVPVEGRT